MRVNELIKAFNCNVGDTISIYYRGEQIYSDFATNYEIRMPDCSTRQVRNFWFRGKGLRISIW